MTPYLSKKNGNLSAITFCLVGLLLLIRINPIYYASQFIPVRQADVHSMPVIRNADTKPGILRCQRGINERIESVSVPQITFSGTPFAAFFGGKNAEVLTSVSLDFFKGAILSGTRRAVILRTLRL